MDHEHNHKKEAECCEDKEKKIRLGKRLKQVGALFIVLFLATYFIPFLSPLNESLISYFKLIWWAILLGLFIGGLIDYFVPEGFVFRFLGGRKKITIIYAVIAGFLMSACSHGILAIAIQLYKKGASIPAVIAFLLASPWANLPVTILLFSFFGIKALFFIFGAMLVAIITGYIYLGLEKSGLIEKSREASTISKEYSWDNIKNFDIGKSARGVLAGAVSLSNMVLWWILIGILIAAVIGAYVPAHIFMQYFGPSFVGLLLTLLLATVIEVCSEGSAPVAFEIFTMVGTLGNPFVFLMAGVATDYTEIGLIWTNMGKKAAIWLPIVTVPQVLLLGYLFNLYL